MVCEVGVRLENSTISNYFKSFCNFAKQGRLNEFEQKWNWTRQRQSTGISTVVRPSWLLILAVCWSSTTSIWPRSRVRMTCLDAFCSLTKQTRLGARWRMRSNWKMPTKFWAQTKVKLDEEEEIWWNLSFLKLFKTFNLCSAKVFAVWPNKQGRWCDEECARAEKFCSNKSEIGRGGGGEGVCWMRSVGISLRPNLSKLLTRVANFSHQHHWWWAEVFAQTSQDEASAFCKLFLANNQNSTGVQVSTSSPWNVTLWGLTDYTNNRRDFGVAFCKSIQNCTGVSQSEPGVTYDLTDESTDRKHRWENYHIMGLKKIVLLGETSYHPLPLEHKNYTFERTIT